MHYFSPIHLSLLWYLCSSKVWNVMAQYLNKYWTVKNLYQCLNKSLMLSLPAFGPKLNWIWLFLCNRNKKLRKSKEIEFYSSLFTFLNRYFPYSLKCKDWSTQSSWRCSESSLCFDQIPNVFFFTKKCFEWKNSTFSQSETLSETV